MAHSIRQMKLEAAATRVRTCAQSDLSLLTESLTAELQDHALSPSYMNNLAGLDVSLLASARTEVLAGVHALLDAAGASPSGKQALRVAHAELMRPLKQLRDVLAKMRAEFASVRDLITTRGALPREHPLVRHFLLKTGWDAQSNWLSLLQNRMPYSDFEPLDEDAPLPIAQLSAEVEHMRALLLDEAFRPETVHPPRRLALSDGRRLSDRVQDSIRALLAYNLVHVADDVSSAIACARAAAAEPTGRLQEPSWLTVLNAARASAELYGVRVGHVKVFEETESFDEPHVHDLKQRGDILQLAHGAALELRELVEALSKLEEEPLPTLLTSARKRLDFDDTSAKRRRVELETNNTPEPYLLASPEEGAATAGGGACAAPSDTAAPTADDGLPELPEAHVPPGASQSSRSVLGMLRASMSIGTRMMNVLTSSLGEDDLGEPAHDAGASCASAADCCIIETHVLAPDGALMEHEDLDCPKICATCSYTRLRDKLYISLKNAGPGDVEVHGCQLDLRPARPAMEKLSREHLTWLDGLVRLSSHYFEASELESFTEDVDDRMHVRMSETSEILIPWAPSAEDAVVVSKIKLDLKMPSCFDGR